MDLKYFTHVPTENILNFRTLGGYPAGKDLKQMTKHGAIYRSARLDNLTENDKKIFNDLNIKTVIDLRSSYEVNESPDFCVNDENINYHNINYMPELNPEALKTMDVEKIKNDMGIMYTSLLEDSKDKVAESLRVVADGLSKGAIVFHCTIGRDRTGVLAMLLMSIAGCHEFDIIANYQVSESYLVPAYTEDFKLITPTFFMKNTMDRIVDKYGSIMEYIKTTGITDEEIQKIRDGFVVDVEY